MTRVGRTTASLTRAYAHEHYTSHHQHTPGEDQKSRPSGIEDRSDEDAAQECQEYVGAKDPAYRACAVL